MPIAQGQGFGGAVKAGKSPISTNYARLSDRWLSLEGHLCYLNSPDLLRRALSLESVSDSLIATL